MRNKGSVLHLVAELKPRDRVVEAVVPLPRGGVGKPTLGVVRHEVAEVLACKPKHK